MNSAARPVTLPVTAQRQVLVDMVKVDMVARAEDTAAKVAMVAVVVKEDRPATLVEDTDTCLVSKFAERLLNCTNNHR